MNETVSFIIQAFIKYGPEVAKQVAAILGKKEVTQADWDALWAVADKSYDDYVNPK